MSLNTAVSGINAAQAALDVTSNDLANVNTTGFKSGTQLFADLFPAGNGPNTPGIGVTESEIDRDFSQGNADTTNNPLDMTIQGSGFFIVNNGGAQQYTRDGSFQIDPSTNQLVTASGNAVLGYPGGATGGANVSPLTISTASQPAAATTSQTMQVALDEGDTAIASSTPFAIANPNSYDQSTSVTAYDALGNPNEVQLYFRRAAGTGTANVPDDWQVYAQPVAASGADVGSAKPLTTLKFGSTGALTGGSSATLNVPWGNGAGSAAVKFGFGGTTLSNQNFAVQSAVGNGFPPGQFQSVSIGSSGAISAQYSNGNKVNAGRIALANFINNQGLSPVSGNLFSATQTSGPAIINSAGTGQAGQIASGQLEQSNVNLSSQLVNLITEQQDYEANAKTISTDQQEVTSLLQA